MQLGLGIFNKSATGEKIRTAIHAQESLTAFKKSILGYMTGMSFGESPGKPW